jgi:hypothetical protein
MKRCLYSIYVPVGGCLALENYKNKFEAFQKYYSNIIESHKKYADSINVDYKLFEKIPTALFHAPTYDQINFCKYHYAKELCEEYDEILYIDFDVIPNTTENFFEVFNVSEYIPVRATIPYNPELINEIINLYDLAHVVIKHNLYVRKYYEGITDKGFHGKPWVAETYPGEFQKKYDLKWWFKLNKIEDDPFIDEVWVAESSKININPRDDEVKYAAIDILTEGKAIFYNTGVMGFCKDTLDQLNIFDDYEDYEKFCETISHVQSENWPEYITNHIGINNEVLFSYKMIKNNVPVKDIGSEWNYYVDWKSTLLNLHNHTFHYDDEYETGKFRHYLNKNFDKEWPI